MDLIDDKHAVVAGRRGHLHLVNELADIVDAIVGGGVELHYVHRLAAVEGAA